MQIKEYKLEKEAIDIFQNFLSDEYPVFLESQRDKEKLGRYSIIASNPFIKIIGKDEILKVQYLTEGKEVISKKKLLEELTNILKKYKIDYRGELPFVGGVIGHFSYELLKEIEKVDIEQIDDLSIPDLNVGIYNEVVVVDHLEDKLYIISNNFLEDSKKRLKDLESKVFEKNLNIKDIFYDNEVIVTSDITKSEYINAINEVKENIRDGNVYQINFTQRFQANLNKSSFTLYKRLRETNKAPFAAYLSYDDYEISCSSPERFIRVVDKKIDTRPIKGTIARGKTNKEDLENKNILKNSKKDQSELLMIVDLERNDLGKISEIGSVKVSELFYIEEYATVFQQIANVSSILREDIDLKDIFYATFPGGSITGAPKIKAMELIGKLEKTNRNIYTGSIGYISFNGNMDLNIVIRTVLCKENKAYYQVGGGIVWDSDPELEYEESLLKGKALREALLWKE